MDYECLQEDEGKRTQSDASDHNLPPLSTSDQGISAITACYFLEISTPKG